MHAQQLKNGILLNCNSLARNSDAMPTSAIIHQHVLLQHTQQQMEVLNDERENLLMAKKLTDDSKSVIIKVRAQIERFIATLQQNTELQKHQSQEDYFIEMLQSQHT
ncbi:unnamed protein product [Onchocerca flexuosa]|nr:unnamed protein product [Onchocerca flexuosa]